MKVRRGDTGNLVDLGRTNFILAGGQGSVYADGDYCIKVYTDPSDMIPAGKLAELAPLGTKDIMAPLCAVTRKGDPVGYVMRRAAHCLPLPGIVSKAWRTDNGFGPDEALVAVLRLRALFAHVHAHSALVIDPNDMNFLLRESLDEVVGIDVDSYATEHYPGDAIQPIVRDPARSEFSSDTDWYGFGLLAFALMVGSHPFKGSMQGYGRGVDGILERMTDGASALRKESRLPASCQPLSVIPGNWRSWFEVIFHSSERPLPPDEAGQWKLVPCQTATGADSVVLTRIRDLLPSGVLVNDPYPVTRTPGRVVSKTPVECRFPSEAAESSDGRVYVQHQGSVSELRTVRTGTLVRTVARRICRISRDSTVLYRGVAIQSTLGAVIAHIFPRSGQCTQVVLSEVVGARIVAAKFTGGSGKRRHTGVLRVTAIHQSGAKTHTWCGLDGQRFCHHQVDYDVPVEVAELDTGVAAASHPDGIVLFAPGAPHKTRLIKDPRLAGVRIEAEPGSLVAYLPDGVYSVKIP